MNEGTRVLLCSAGGPTPPAHLESPPLSLAAADAAEISMRFDLSPAKIPTGSAAPGSDAPQLGSAPYDTDSSKAWLRSFLLSEADVSNVAAARAELVKPIPRMRVDVDLARHASQAKLFTFEAPAHAATADGAAACSTIVKRLALWLMRQCSSTSPASRQNRWSCLSTT